MKNRATKQILLVRTDRIGDVVLTLPMIDEIKKNLTTARISFLVRSYTKGLVEHHPHIDKVLLDDERSIHRPFFSLLREIRNEKFDVTFVVYPTFRLALLLFLARIPIRVGTGFRWYSFLFNKRVFEHRKTAQKHEAEYNLSLLRAVGWNVTDFPSPRLYINSGVDKRVEKICQRLKISENSSLVILHPGSGGSARDWPAYRFGELGLLFSNAGYTVVVTGGPGEQSLVEIVTKTARSQVFTLVDTFSLEELAMFVKRASLFISNSTGPLHIAAAMGVPVIGFYPPIKACSSRRWGPLTDRKFIFEPLSRDCPRCRGTECRGDDCMSLITVNDVFEASQRLMSSKETKN